MNYSKQGRNILIGKRIVMLCTTMNRRTHQVILILKLNQTASGSASNSKPTELIDFDPEQMKALQKNQPRQMPELPKGKSPVGCK